LEVFIDEASAKGKEIQNKTSTSLVLMNRKNTIVCLLILNSLAFGLKAQNDSLSNETFINDSSTDDINEAYSDGFDLIAKYDSITSLDFLFNGDVLALSVEPSDPTFSIPDSIIKLQLEILNEKTPIELLYTDDVGKFIDLYARRKSGLTERVMGLADIYFPMIEEMLDRYEMPLELKYLAVVESALNPNARSRVGATGLWQFMYATGKGYGLYVDSYIDERRDPYLATEAACRYLSFLHAIYGDWNLALAAYNSGPGNVNKAIRRSGGKKTYWEIRNYLPRETRSYVPAFIAVNYVMAYYEDYHLRKKPVVMDYTYTDTIHVDQRVVFEYLSAYTGVDIPMLKFLNPMYQRNVVPLNKEKEYAIVLPKERVAVFIINADSVYAKSEIENPEFEMPEKNQNVVYYYVKSGDVLGKIAQRYGVRVSDIQEWNNIRGTRIDIGQKLMIYTNRP